MEKCFENCINIVGPYRTENWLTSYQLTSSKELCSMKLILNCLDHRPTFADRGCDVASATDPYGR
jgi:hypothetical protein